MYSFGFIEAFMTLNVVHDNSENISFFKIDTMSDGSSPPGIVEEEVGDDPLEVVEESLALDEGNDKEI